MTSYNSDGISSVPKSTQKSVNVSRFLMFGTVTDTAGISNTYRIAACCGATPNFEQALINSMH